MVLGGPVVITLLAIRTNSLLEPLQQTWALPLLTVGAGLGNWYWATWGSVVSHGLYRGAADPIIFLPALIIFHLYAGMALSDALAGVKDTNTKIRHALAELVACALSFLFLCSVESSVAAWRWSIGSLAIVFGASPVLEQCWVWYRRSKTKRSQMRIAVTASMLIRKAHRLVSLTRVAQQAAAGAAVAAVTDATAAPGVAQPEPSVEDRESVFASVLQKDGLPLVGPSVGYVPILNELDTGTYAIRFETIRLDPTF
jgi:hypothetical protein